MNSMDASQRRKGIRTATIAGFLVVMMAPVLALAQTATATAPDTAVEFYPGPNMMGGWGFGMMGAFGLFWGLLCLLALVGIVGGIVFLIRGAFACKHRHGCKSSMADNENGVALKLLDERYARGEIERDEYLEKRGDLGK
ncbi:SHOCT domain-containing protein [Acidithiobacillus ferrivorans]|uniref:SHOCT domain-containing protein n=1 Tax=Acidithiobacillus ferrivorans TaxID=160808 RepID=A0A7T4WD58_9PROT|nr:SHOCT domain-containing protein [Acidithiobacillus ferrivorans]QQD72390.1 SHOCT domain-containing protein [Acidithiobacillus ferrivorans]